MDESTSEDWNAAADELLAVIRTWCHERVQPHWMDAEIDKFLKESPEGMGGWISDASVKFFVIDRKCLWCDELTAVLIRRIPHANAIIEAARDYGRAYESQSNIELNRCSPALMSAAAAFCLAERQNKEAGQILREQN